MTHYSLLEFTRIVKQTIEKNLDPTYWVVAEIGELRVHPKGHCYLELVEKQNEQIVARMKATIWSYTYHELIHWFQRITGTDLKEGMKILTNVEVQFHEAYGLSLNIHDIDANYTLGERQKIKKEILNRLEQEGLINRNKELSHPLVPQNIAIISSSHSAGYEDFLGQLKSSNYAFHTSFFPAEMQGPDATKSVVNALKTIFEKINDYNLVVILRGGGAQADLDCFNTYLMGKAIARFPLPVITGIGHERDETVADIVARTKLKTPTAVAEFLINGMRSFEDGLTKNFEIILGKAQRELITKTNEVHQKADKIKYSFGQLLINANSRTVVTQQRVINALGHQKKHRINELDRFSKKVNLSMQVCLNKSNQELAAMEKFFHFSDPQYTLQRGFTYSTIDEEPIYKKKKLQIGDIIKTLTSDQTIKSIIEEIN